MGGRVGGRRGDVESCVEGAKAGELASGRSGKDGRI